MIISYKIKDKQIVIDKLDFKTLYKLIDFDCYDTACIEIVQKKFSRKDVTDAIEHFTHCIRSLFVEDTDEFENIQINGIASILEYLIALKEECTDGYIDDLVWFETAAGHQVWNNILRTEWLRTNIFNSDKPSPRYFNNKLKVKIIYQN